MSIDRLSDGQVRRAIALADPDKPTFDPINITAALAREVQERRAAEPTFTSVVHDCCVTAAPIDALCARHDITVEGIVALVDEVFQHAAVEPEHANITEAMEDGLHREDMYYAGWEVGYYDAMTAARRLARGEGA